MKSIVWSDADLVVTQPWGCTDLLVEPWWSLAGCHWHCGIDIGMDVGTALHAARGGRVTYVGYGLLAISGPTYTDWYVHIDSSHVGLGAPIDRGNLVAFSGAKVPSGGSLTGPHLHFESQESSQALLGAKAAGYLNFPATSLDPEPVLTATFGPGGGTIGDDMTPAQEQTLNACYAILSGARINTKAVDQALADIEREVKALPAGGGTEPPEPAEPKTVTLNITSVPGTATGTIL